MAASTRQAFLAVGAIAFMGVGDYGINSSRTFILRGGTRCDLVSLRPSLARSSTILRLVQRISETEQVAPLYVSVRCHHRGTIHLAARGYR